jgi:hypothetical protein
MVFFVSPGTHGVTAGNGGRGITDGGTENADGGSGIVIIRYRI